MPGRSKLGRDAMRGRASVADGRASEVPGLSRACCSARRAVPDVSGRDASIRRLGLEESTTGQPARAATGSWCAACCWRWCLIHLPSSVSGGAAKVPFRCRYARSSSKRSSQSSESCCGVLPRGSASRPAPRRAQGAWLCAAGAPWLLLVGHRAASFGGQLAALFRFSYARRGGVQRRALREAKGDGAADALRRWACSCLCGPPARLQMLRLARLEIPRASGRETLAAKNVSVVAAWQSACLRHR